MTNLFTYLSNWKLKYISALVIMLCLGIGQMWASTKTTTFKDKSSGTWAQNKDPLPYESGGVAWTASATPYSFESSSPSRNVQWSASSIKNTSFTITNTSLSSYSIAKVSLVASTNSNANLVHISVSVGGTSFGSADMSKTNNTTYNFPSTGQNAATGNIVITVSGDNNSNTKSFYLKSITVTYCAVPTSPTNGTITASTADLSWTDAANVGHYDVYCSTSSTAPAINATPTITGITNKYATVTSLSSSNSYYWWVRAYDNDCKSKWVAGSSFTTSAAVTTYTIYVPNTAGSCSSVGSYTSDKGTSGSGTGTWTGYTAYSGITAGTTVTITATPESGYKFDGWTSGGYSIIMDEEAEEVTPSSTTSTTATFDMPSSDVYIMECAFSTACSYQVALTKGAQTNGSFSLSESNGSYDNCDANFVVTVSSISPSSGYGCTGVTATGGNSTVTGPDGSGNYTVTYTKGNSITSTVTANFAEKVATPTFSVSEGTYNATQSVTLSCATDGATIYYTTNGSTPTTSSSVYSSAISVTSTNTTIKAIAAKSSMANSDVASATYVIKCATPVISPVTGSYTGAQDVTITCATAGASIYYTNNGGTPSSSSISYSAFSIDATKTIKAIATKSGWTDSDIATSTITVQYGITWMVNGVAWTPHDPDSDPDDGKENGSSLVNSGTQWSALTLPTDPEPDEDGCGQKFIGWITNTITGELDKTKDASAISALDILNSGNKASKTSETITGATTFYAVFADYAE